MNKLEKLGLLMTLVGFWMNTQKYEDSILVSYFGVVGWIIQVGIMLMFLSIGLNLFFRNDD